MAVPKRRTSKQRRKLRRSNVWRLVPPNLISCPKCGELKLSHRVCKACGTYDGREVIVKKEKKA
ncbi:MAG: 50S ribosomal protein L32 [Oscillospiraceae bacterium]|nr:50S ribosomal protein L32 [Oscillospiraceae bacterium]